MGQETRLCLQAFPSLVSQLLGRWKGFALPSKARNVSFFVMLLLSMFGSLCFHDFKNEQFR